MKDAKIELIHHGEDYWQIEVNGKYSEIGEFEGNVIQELLRRVEEVK